MPRLTDSSVKTLGAPDVGNRVFYDDTIAGFGIRVTAAGARAFVLNYRTRGGRERRITIGNFPDWKTGAARTEAAELKCRIDRGEDPLAESEAERSAKTVADLIRRFEDEHVPKTRPSTAASYQTLIARHIEPALKHMKVRDVSFEDIDTLHRKMSKCAPYQANRALAVLSKMFALAIRWRWRPDNPVRGVERNQEHKRQRFLSGVELARLTTALATHQDRQAADIVRLLLLTGARRGEALRARWDQFDLEVGVWLKPGSTTKQKTEHRSPLSAPARQLLSEIRESAETIAKKARRDVPDFVFPGRGGSGHRVEIKKDWTALCAAAGITGARLHDLRHTYASILASAGLSLPIIGALLGHSNPATTSRYSHLLDDPLRAATERAGAIISGRANAEIVQIKSAS